MLIHSLCRLVLLFVLSPALASAVNGAAFTVQVDAAVGISMICHGPSGCSVRTTRDSYKGLTRISEVEPHVEGRYSRETASSCRTISWYSPAFQNSWPSRHFHAVEEFSSHAKIYLVSKRGRCFTGPGVILIIGGTFYFGNLAAEIQCIERNCRGPYTPKQPNIALDLVLWSIPTLMLCFGLKLSRQFGLFYIAAVCIFWLLLNPVALWMLQWLQPSLGM